MSPSALWYFVTALIVRTASRRSGAQLMSDVGGGGSSKPGSKTSNMALITLFCGIGSWMMLPFFASIVGIITGWIELQNIKKGESDESNKTITMIGFVLSVVNVVGSVMLGCFVLALYLGVFGAFFAFGPELQQAPIAP